MHAPLRTARKDPHGYKQTKMKASREDGGGQRRVSSGPAQGWEVHSG